MWSILRRLSSTKEILMQTRWWGPAPPPWEGAADHWWCGARHPTNTWCRAKKHMPSTLTRRPRVQIRWWGPAPLPLDGAVDCAVGRQISMHRERERKRERGCTASQHIESRNGEDPRPARADGMYQADTVWNEHHSHRRVAHQGVGMIRETQRWRHDLSKHKLNMSVIETWSLETATETRQTSLLKSVVVLVGTNVWTVVTLLVSYFCVYNYVMSFQ